MYHHYLVTLLFLFLNIDNAVQQPRQARMSVFPVLTNYQESNATLWSETLTTPMMKHPPLIRVSQVSSSSVITEEKIIETTEKISPGNSVTMTSQLPILRRMGVAPKAVRRVKPTTTSLPTSTDKETPDDEDYQDESEEEEEEEEEEEKPVGTSSVSPLRNQILFHPRNKFIHQIGNKNSSRPIVLKRTTARTTNKPSPSPSPSPRPQRSTTSTTTAIPVTTKKLSYKHKFRSTVPTTRTATLVTQTSSAKTTKRTAEITGRERDLQSTTTTAIPTLPVNSENEQENAGVVGTGSWSNVEAAVEESNYYGRMSEPEVEVADHWGGDAMEQQVVEHGALL